MAKLCPCDNKNTGYSQCEKALREGLGVILMHRYSADGSTLNRIDLGQEITEDYVNSKLQAPDKKDRWYPVANGEVIKNMELNTIEAQTESYNDGSTAKTTDSRLILENMFIQNASPAYLGVLDSFCGSMSAFVIDEKGTLVGQLLPSDRENLYPKNISKPSYNVSWKGASGGSVSGVTMSFEFSKTDRIEDIRTVHGDSIQVNLNDLSGLFDVNLDVVVTSSTTLEITTSDCFSYPPAGVLGMTDTTDWLIKDKDGLVLATVSASDLANIGKYIVTHPDATGLYPITVESGATVYAKNYELTPVTVPAP